MSILELNIHACEQGQVTNITEFKVAFFCLKYISVYFTKKNEIPGQTLMKHK